MKRREMIDAALLPPHPGMSDYGHYLKSRVALLKLMPYVVKIAPRRALELVMVNVWCQEQFGAPVTGRTAWNLAGRWDVLDGYVFRFEEDAALFKLFWG